MQLATFFIASFALLCVIHVSSGKPQASSTKSDCQVHRERELRSKPPTQLVGRLIPECDQDGSYKPLQCHNATTTKGDKWCQCWTKNGDIVSQPSRKLKACSCVLDRAAKEKQRATPMECEVDGSFKKKQCASTSCRCVDPLTGQDIKTGTTTLVC